MVAYRACNATGLRAASVKVTRRQCLGIAAAGSTAVLGNLPASSGPDAGQRLAPRKQPIGLDYFGLHIHDLTTAWPDFQFGQLRLWDTRTSWFNLQPQPDRWVFDRLDGFVQKAAKHGVGLLLPLGMPPTWAAARPTERSPYNVPGAASEPSDMATWRTYVQTVANRYKGQVRRYEIWNEVNAGTGFFTGTPESMFELQRAAYEVLKSVDPGITVISPSTEGSTEDKFVWFERYMTLMAGRYADAVAYHFYNPRKPPEALQLVVQRVQAILARTGSGHLPLWNTESGYRVDWGSTEPLTGIWATWPNLPPARAAAWLVRAYLLGWLVGLDAYFWYGYDSGVMGMVPASHEPSVVSRSMGHLIHHLVGAVVDDLISTNAVARVRVRQRDGDCWWVWSVDDQDRQWSIPASLGAKRALALDDTPLDLKDGRVGLAAMPIRLLLS